MERLPSSKIQSPSSITLSIMSRVGRIISIRYTGLLRAPDKRLAKETDAVTDTIFIHNPCLNQITCDPFRFNTEEIFQDFLVLAFPEHVTVMSIGVHLFKFGRDNTAGPENYDMVARRVQNLGNYRPYETGDLGLYL